MLASTGKTFGLKLLDVILKWRKNLEVICSRINEIECSTFFWQRVAKLSTGLVPPAFVITNNTIMNNAK